MNTRHLVDPELVGLLDLLPVFELNEQTLPLVRARTFPRPPMPPVAVDQQVVVAPGRDGAPEVPLHCYRPSDAEGALPCILHMHGGGYVAGKVDDLRDIHRSLSAELGCAIVSVDYRLAPETHFPGNIEDCYAALAHVVSHAATLGIDTRRLGVMGESAGGGLAAALALLARDRGEYKLVFQHLIYPMIDDRTCVRAPHPTAGEFVWNADKNAFGWTALLGHAPGGDDVSPYAAAARASDLAGLPPTYIATGAIDLFVDEDLDYAKRLIAAGVPCELHVYPGAFHAFNIVPDARVAQAARRDSIEALRRALHG
ncbi:triacylglycerol lipase [Sphingomonas palmae]|uniref:Triacylglycerol lipase n=1 Tax=Sphingomonas palmae TaxID=1855283 RepID=A0A1H7L6L8_9SPHN|nr:alpha/beta hydrolase [Sphingomonas palmae]SEK94484.1 triacylglycerol lipase [Sphingomonas palmae]